MKRLLLGMLIVPALALGAEERTGAASADPMAGWVPPKVKNEAKDKQEIQAVLRAMESAGRSGDLEAAAGLCDFPVLMMTDNSKGETKADVWSREKWTEAMKPLYATPMKDVKMTHKPTIFMLSDSLASVGDVWTMTKGGKTVTGRSSMLMGRIDGKWRVKAMVEGGWGDMMAAEPTASGSQTGTSQGTGSMAEPPASQGTGTRGDAGSGTGTMGSGTTTEPPASQGTGTETGTPPKPGTGTETGTPPQPK